MSTETDERDHAPGPQAPVDSEPGEGASGQQATRPPGGQARAGKLGLADVDSLHRALSTAFADIVAYAGSMVALVDEDPARAVHEYRKSLRRARALVRMLAGALGDETAAELTDALRRAQRATSDLRDGSVLRTQLGALSDSKGWRKVVPELVQGIEAPEHGPAYTRSVLEMGASLIDGLPARFEQALPPDVGWDAVGAGLKASYQRARNKLQRARKSSEVAALHDFRKRTKELTYQAELLSAGQGGTVRKQHKRLARLSGRLGGITDLLLLRAHLVPPGADDSGDRRRRKLARRLDRTIDRRTARALKRGRTLLERKPGRFAARLLERRRQPGNDTP